MDKADTAQSSTPMEEEAVVALIQMGRTVQIIPVKESLLPLERWGERQTLPRMLSNAKTEVLVEVGPAMPLMNLPVEEAFLAAVEADMADRGKLMARTDLPAAEVPSTAEATRSTKQVQMGATARS